MKRYALAAFVALIACGCVGTGDVEPETNSSCDSIQINGARLRKKHRISADGAVETIPGWFDDGIGAACTFRIAADGEQRCLPQAQNANYFTDAACTRRAIYMYDPLCGDPQWGSWTDASGAECVDGGEHIATVHGRAGVTTLFYVSSSGECDSVDVKPGFVAFELNAESHPSTFVWSSVD